MKPLCMAEAKKIVEASKEKDKEIVGFLKKFIKIDKKIDEMKEELEDTGIIKLKEADIVKIIDVLPEDASDLNKIFSEISLDEDETNKILEVVKKFS